MAGRASQQKRESCNSETVGQGPEASSRLVWDAAKIFMPVPVRRALAHFWYSRLSHVWKALLLCLRSTRHSEYRSILKPGIPKDNGSSEGPKGCHPVSCGTSRCREAEIRKFEAWRQLKMPNALCQCHRQTAERCKCLELRDLAPLAPCIAADFFYML